MRSWMLEAAICDSPDMTTEGLKKRHGLAAAAAGKQRPGQSCGDEFSRAKRV